MTNFKGHSFTFFGRSGSGKGTQFDLFEKKLRGDGYSVLRHTSGDVFRELAKKDTIAGKRVKEILDMGGLMPAWLASFTWLKSIIEKLQSEDAVALFDGSPRTVEEAMRFDEVFVWLKRDSITPVYIDVSSDEVVRRLLLRGRSDDTEGVIRERLKWFDKDVAPIVDYYKNQNRLLTVDGTGTIEEVFGRILRAFL